MRIAVRDLHLRHQHAFFAQPIDDHRVGGIGVKTDETAGIFGQHAVIVHGHVNGQAEFHTYQIVVLAMAGSRMHGSGAGVKRNVIAVDDLALAVLADGARIRDALQFGTLHDNGLTAGIVHRFV